MAQFHIRDFPDNLVEGVDEMARAAGKSRETWLRDLVISATAEPLIKKRYGYRFYDTKSLGHGIIRRLGGEPCIISNADGEGSMNSAQMNAYKQATLLIQRNLPGDREEAIHLLKSQFDNVFEIPV
jgi:hypothetical protein